jgi:hypothetical protein
MYQNGPIQSRGTSYGFRIPGTVEGGRDEFGNRVSIQLRSPCGRTFDVPWVIFGTDPYFFGFFGLDVFVLCPKIGSTRKSVLVLLVSRPHGLAIG